MSVQLFVGLVHELSLRCNVGTVWSRKAKSAASESSRLIASMCADTGISRHYSCPVPCCPVLPVWCAAVLSCLLPSRSLLSCPVLSCGEKRTLPSCPVLSCLVLSCPVLCCPVPCRPVLSCPVLSCIPLFCHVLCCLVLSSPLMSRPVPRCPVLPCVVLRCPVLHCPVLSSAVLSCPLR